MKLKISPDPPGQFKRLGSQGLGGAVNGGGDDSQPEANGTNIQGVY
jgi:hypothetical protein